MPEIEIHAAPGEHEGGSLVLPVSLTISILAVLVAAASLMGHRAHTEELLLNGQASDQWSYYQAKNNRQYTAKKLAGLLSVVTTKDAEKAEKLLKEDLEEEASYGSDKDETSEKAKELEKERDVFRKQADRFDAGEGILEIALVICSITLLTNKKAFWFAGILIGAVGLAAALAGFLVH
jgi:hypothetical protein